MIIIYRNIGSGGTQAIIESLPGDAIRITIQMARPWTFRPGQYMFVTVPSVGLWTSHPFSLAWSSDSEEETLDPEKGLAPSRTDVLALPRASMSAIIRKRDGFTHLMFKKAEQSSGRFVSNALVEGPYGGQHSLHSYGTVLLFAGGVGITHQLPYVRDLIVGFANGTVSARRILLVWIIQSPEHLEWIRPWSRSYFLTDTYYGVILTIIVTTILALDRRRDILRIQLFVTRPRSTKEIHSPSSTVQMFPGRPNVETLVELESDNQVGAMAVSVCGPGNLADDVRRAVRKQQGRNVDFVEESFSW